MAHACQCTIEGPLRLEGIGDWENGRHPVFLATAHVAAQHQQQLGPILRLITVGRGEGSFELQPNQKNSPPAPAAALRSLSKASLTRSQPHDDRGDQDDRGARRDHPAGGAGMGLDPLVERQIHRVRAFD